MVPHRGRQDCAPVARGHGLWVFPQGLHCPAAPTPLSQAEGENVCQKNKFIKCQLNQMSFHIAHGEGQHLMETLSGFTASSLSADGVFITNGCVQCAPLKALEIISSSLQACNVSKFQLPVSPISLPHSFLLSPSKELQTLEVVKPM